MVGTLPKNPFSNRDTRRQSVSSEESPYLKALIRDGISTYIQNVCAQMELFRIDGETLPVVVPEVRRDQVHICSPLVHYVRYTEVEIAKRNPKVPEWLFRAGFGPYGALLRLLDLDRVVYINNWLFSTNPDHNLSSEQIRKVTTRLIDRYPDRAIVHSTVNPRLNRRLYETLLANGYAMTPSRTVYLLDAREAGWRRKRNNEIDLKLLAQTPYEIVPSDDLAEADAETFARLYARIYLDRHTPLNPHLTGRFFALTLRDQVFEYRALRKDGVIHAYVNWFMSNGIMVSSTLGYDVGVPLETGLYRQLIAILISEAADKGLLLNLSGGTGKFKTLRGAVPVVEFDAVYDRHLTSRRRLAWRILRLQGRAWSSAG